MCQLKSGIILKDRVFVPEYNSHTDMLEELGIKDTQANAEKLFVRAELLPPDGDVFKPVDEWKFHVDQDIIPDWFIEEVDEERMVEAVKEWAKDHVHIGVNNLSIKASGCHYVKDCKNVKACDSATVKAYGSATVKAYGSATVEACDSATVKACDSATVKAYGSATVEAYVSATVEAYGSATVIIPNYSLNNRDNIIISDNATIKDFKTKTIWQSGNWSVQII